MSDNQNIDFDPHNTDPNELIVELMNKKHVTGVLKILDSYYKTLHKSTLLKTLIYLAKKHNNTNVIPQYYKRISKHYPIEVACLKAYLLLDKCPPLELMERGDEALAILNEARKEYKDSGILLENIALIYAKKQNKDMALKYVKKYMVKEEKGSYSRLPILLMIRILRSNCQFDEALKLVKSSFDILGKYDKYILIEGMFIAAEEGNMEEMKIYFQKLKKLFKTDNRVMVASVRLNLMLGKLQSATECFQSWSDLESNQQSAEFLFYFGQLYVASKEYNEGIKYLKFAIEMDPFNAEYISSLATALNSFGNKEAAIETAKSAIEVDPYCFHGYLALSIINQDQKEASEALDKAIELRKKFIDLTYLKIALN